MLRICRRYLKWVQNSVFEGEISEAKYKEMIVHLTKLIKEKDSDSIVVYKFRTMQYSEREVHGKDKKGDTQFI